MSGIRVTYSGLISLIITFSTIITGTVFTLIVKPPWLKHSKQSMAILLAMVVIEA